MGGSKPASKNNKVTIERYNTILNLLEKLNSIKNSERIDLIKSFKKKQVNLITEIVFNFLKGTYFIPTPAFQLLNKIKSTVRVLGSKKTSLSKKQSVLSSIKGLQVINILTPYILKILKE